MKPIKVRLIRPEDEELFVDWSARNLSHNQFDPDVLSYPQTTVLCAEDEQPEMFMPVQLAVVLESLAPRPDATPLKRAAAIRRLVFTVAELAKKIGVGELYFVSKDQDIIDMALRHGFEKAPGTVLRLKLKKLGESNATNHN